MSTVPPAGTHAGAGAPAYARHRPEGTLLYRLVEEHYPAFVARLAAEGRTLPRHVAREFEDFLGCGRLENGFLRVACEGCRAERLVAFSCKRRGFCPSCGARRMAESAALLVDEVFPARPVRQWVLSVPWQLRLLFANDPGVMGAALGVVHRCITSHLITKAGLSVKDARTGAVTLIQRFGGALNLNVHFHMLFLDGVYVKRPDGTLRFRRIGAPTSAELDALTRIIAHRIGRLLERRGLLERDAENAWLAGDDGAEPTPIDELRAASVTYRVAIGPRRGQKAFTVRTLPPAPDEPLDDQPDGAGGFSLHAGVATGANERTKLERLCRPVSVRQPSRPVREAAVAHRRRPCPLPVQDPLARRHHRRRARAARLPRPPRRARSQAAREPHPLPRRVRSQQPLPRARHACRARPGCQQSARRPLFRPCRRLRATCFERLGAASQTCLRHRRRGLRRLRRATSNHRLHRGPSHRRIDPGPSRTPGPRIGLDRHRRPLPCSSEPPGDRAPSLTGSHRLAHPDVPRSAPYRASPGAEPAASGVAVPVAWARLAEGPVPGLATVRAASPAPGRACRAREPPHVSSRTELPEGACAGSR